jgi:hypothetical protein
MHLYVYLLEFAPKSPEGDLKKKPPLGGWGQ